LWFSSAEVDLVWLAVLLDAVRQVRSTAQLVGEPLALLIEDEAAAAAQGLGGQELAGGARLRGVEEPGGMHLHALHVH
jgi:hypothetical protein